MKYKIPLAGAAAVGTLGLVAFLTSQESKRYEKVRVQAPLEQAETTTGSLDLKANAEGAISELLVEGPVNVRKEPAEQEGKSRLVIAFAGEPSPLPTDPPPTTPPPTDPPPTAPPSDPPPTTPPPTAPPSDPPHPPGECVVGQACKPPAGRYSDSCELQDGIPTCVPPTWLPSYSCASLPDDPIGLERSGPGCDVRGGTGTGTIVVNKLGPDNSPGTLRWAYRQIGPNDRRIVCDPALTGDIVLDTPLRWEKPHATWDFSMCDVTVKPVKAFMGTVVFSGGAHDLQLYSIRHEGKFQIPHRRTQNAGMMAFDGYDPTPSVWSWCVGHKSKSYVAGILMDRVTTTKCEDDCQMTWEGVRDVTISRFFIQGFHPTTMGSGGWPRPPARQRLRIGYLYGVWFDSGERQIKPRESSHLWVYARNLIYNWKVIPTTDNQQSEGIGLNLSDDAMDENDWGWIIAPRFLPGPDTIAKNLKLRGCIIGNHEYCEDPSCPGGPQSKIVGCCNPKMVKTRWWVEGIEGPNRECQTNPPDYVAAALPFTVDKTRPWSKVLAEVGVVKRNAAEQAKIDEIAARLAQN